MTTVRAASSVTLSVALAASVAVRREAVPRREAAAPEEALREAVPHEARHRETLAVAAVAPAVMRTTTTHRAAVAEAVGDDLFGHKTDKTFKTIVVGRSNGTQPGCRCHPD